MTDKHANGTKTTPVPAASQYWQRSVASLMRANEKILTGLTSAGRRELELGQELLRHQLSGTKLSQGSSSTNFPNYANLFQENFESFGIMLSGVREIASDLTQCISGASRELLEELTSAGQEAITEASAAATIEAERFSFGVLKVAESGRAASVNSSDK